MARAALGDVPAQTLVQVALLDAQRADAVADAACCSAWGVIVRRQGTTTEEEGASEPGNALESVSYSSGLT
jgi:hypothetical protein